ncbi:hypothetical protein D3C84_750300 [compost metagenome]
MGRDDPVDLLARLMLHHHPQGMGLAGQVRFAGQHRHQKLLHSGERFDQVWAFHVVGAGQGDDPLLLTLLEPTVQGGLGELLTMCCYPLGQVELALVIGSNKAQDAASLLACHGVGLHKGIQGGQDHHLGSGPLLAFLRQAVEAHQAVAFVLLNGGFGCLLFGLQLGYQLLGRHHHRVVLL